MAEFLATAGSALRVAGRAVLDVLLPPTCLTCDVVVDEPGRLCAGCFAQTGFITDPCCDACGMPLGRPGSDRGVRGRDRVCVPCGIAPPPWQRGRAALRYDSQGKRMVLPLKYHDRVDFAAALAPMMVRAGAGLLREADLLVPVPLHRGRLLSRRYNQAALLAQAIAGLAGRPTLLDALSRVRATRPLEALSATARARMVSGAFAVRPHRREAIAGRRVLLIDDVLTSGSTSGACTRALLDAGASAVDILVAARVVAPAYAEPSPALGGALSAR